jgi:hypothetical protein
VRKVLYIFNILDINHLLPIRVAARSQAWIYGRLLAGIAGSYPAGGVHVVYCEYCELFMYRSLRRADQSSRGVLQNVVCVAE